MDKNDSTVKPPPRVMKKAIDKSDIENIKSSILLLKQEKNTGAIPEFGVYEGYSLSEIVLAVRENEISNKVYGFDSFSGLPGSERHWHKGQASSSLENTKELMTEKLSHIDDVTFIEGIYEETLSEDIRDDIGEDAIAMIHIDCDLSLSCKFVLESCKNAMNVGTIIAVHDWYHGLKEIWQEFQEKYSIKTKSIFSSATQEILQITEI